MVLKYGVFILTGPPLNLLCVGQKVTDFKKMAPIGIENVKVFGISPFSATILRTFPKQGGASRGIFWGGQSRDIFRGGPVKKTTLYHVIPVILYSRTFVAN